MDTKKLAFLSSTQANESFNNIVASKAPKGRHYSESSSLKYCLCASVGQKNEGHTYMTGVHKAAGLSPSVSAIKRGHRQDMLLKRKRGVQNSITFKRRCLQLKSERTSKETAAETREGDTYVSNIGMEKEVPDLNEIPIAASGPIYSSDDVSYVTFDLETGGFSRTCDILQISAICTGVEFDRYICPEQPITEGASSVTKLTVKDGHLYFDGNLVETVTLKQALVEFINFLKGLNKPVLVGHNIKTFDLMFLHHHLNRINKWENFLSVVIGFVDTKLIFKKEFPQQHSYTQANLMSDLLHESYAAHNSLDDVKALAKLSQLVQHKFPHYSFGGSDIRNLVNAAQYKKTLQPLQLKKALSESMATKIGRAGLNHDHLKIAYDRNGFDGLVSVLSEKVNGVVRVTKSVQVIQRIFDYFSPGEV